MPDYGHDLEFSTFPEPRASPPQAAVDAAVLSERWGYDLVSFQDHPYQPGYLDAWMLMSWVAARTSKIRIASNVTNMAMRSPAIVAKSAASIDLLSGGRFDLGLGAGYFWDAMVTMGVARRTPAESINALGEAVDVIRSIWAGDSGGHSVGGEHHHVDAAGHGPAPAHRIPLWLGAYKPRMLRLVGAKADGWTATLGVGNIQTRAQWQAASDAIDTAAVDAGRNPADIRRLAAVTGDFTGRDGRYLRGAPRQWVDQLLPSVVEDGVATFILATDDHRTLQEFAEEVAPALRDATAAERHTSSRGPTDGQTN